MYDVIIKLNYVGNKSIGNNFWSLFNKSLNVIHIILFFKKDGFIKFKENKVVVKCFSNEPWLKEWLTYIHYISTSLGEENVQ